MLWPFTLLSRQGHAAAAAADKPVRGRSHVISRPVHGRYDAAQNTPSNRNHWAAADSLSAAAALTPSVRARLRNRARYEVANNSYAKGVVLTLANDTIGRGPRLQMLTDDKDFNEGVERRFEAWSHAVGLSRKLQTMRKAKAEDGEAFALLISNPALAVEEMLDLNLIEAEMVARPIGRLTGSNLADGIEYDKYGNPVTYSILKHHPGGSSWMPGPDEVMKVGAGDVLHWYRVDRPGQLRGVPDICPALPLFAQLRRYTLAVITSAEIVADMAVLMKTQNPPDAGAADVDPATEMEWSPGQMVFTPEGWEPWQMKAEQPSTTYEMFKRAILSEIARCLNMPYNVAAGDSSDYNYASGRLDHQTYFRSIGVEQAQVEEVILDPVLAAWLTEVFGSGQDAHAKHQWFWRGREHVDPAKEARAQAERLQSLTTTLAAEYALQGRDWETELKQLAEEKKLMEKLGLTAPKGSSAEVTDGDEKDEEDDDEE